MIEGLSAAVWGAQPGTLFSPFSVSSTGDLSSIENTLVNEQGDDVSLKKGLR